jgi:hypothetical protein
MRWNQELLSLARICFFAFFISALISFFDRVKYSTIELIRLSLPLGLCCGLFLYFSHSSIVCLFVSLLLGACPNIVCLMLLGWFCFTFYLSSKVSSVLVLRPDLVRSSSLDSPVCCFGSVSPCQLPSSQIDWVMLFAFPNQMYWLCGSCNWFWVCVELN